jgi:hypothetical protein
MMGKSAVNVRNNSMVLTEEGKYLLSELNGFY